MIEDFRLGQFSELAVDEGIYVVLLICAGLAAIVLLTCAWGIARRRSSLQHFGLDSERFVEWLASCNRRRWLRATTLAIALAFLAIAASQPQCNPEKTEFRKKARDIAVLLDVSRSMLAEDLKPNRLESAKLQLIRLCDHLEGDNIGLITFAGNAQIQSPLTSDYAYFKSTVKNITTRSATQGGTKIGDAIRKALRDLLGIDSRIPEEDRGPTVGEQTIESDFEEDEQEVKFADILLITDGEDHTSYPVRAAEQAGEAGIGLYILALGNEQGAPIPIPKKNGGTKLLTYNGEIVLSRPDSKTLREMVLKTPRGSFTPTGDSQFDIVDIFDETLGREKGREVSEEFVSWTEIYQPFLIAGMLFHFLFLLIPERPGRQNSAVMLETQTS